RWNSHVSSETDLRRAAHSKRSAPVAKASDAPPARDAKGGGELALGAIFRVKRRFSVARPTNTHVSPTPALPPACAGFPRAVASRPPRESRQTSGRVLNRARSDRFRAPTAAE